MLKEIKYNLPRPKGFIRRGVYAQELNLIHDFLASENETMRFEYDSRKSATNARAMLVKYTSNQPIRIVQVQNFVWIARDEKEANK